MGILHRIGTFVPAKLLNNPLAFCSSINFDFLLLRTAHLDKSIILPFLVLRIFTCYIFSALQTIR